MGRGGGYVGDRYRIGIDTGGNQASDMGHVHDEKSTNLISDSPEARPVHYP